MVDDQSHQVERTLPSSTNSVSHYIHRRKQSRLGRYRSRQISSGPLDAQGSQSVYQLERTQSNRSHASLLSRSARHHGINTHRQHHRKIIHKSTRRHQTSQTQSTRHINIGEMSPERPTYPSSIHSGSSEPNRRLCFSPLLQEESMADSSFNLPEDSYPLGPSRHRSFRRSHIQSTSTVYHLETGPGRPSN